jgi:Spy/CpxP family protein refolding chaperone
VNKTWQVVLAFLVVFVAGGAIGSVFTLRLLAERRPAGQGPGTDPNSIARAKPEDFGPALMRRWLLNSNQLGLTPAQKEKIRPIFFDTAEDLQRDREENQHSIILLIEHMQDEIAANLTPEQRNKFYQLIQSQRDKMNRYNKELKRRAMQQQAEPAPAPAP